MRTAQIIIALVATFLTACEDVNVTNTPLPVQSEEVIEPFLVSERTQVKTNNPFDDFQVVVQVPNGKIVVVEYVSASVFGDVQEAEEFELTVSGSARLEGVAQRPRHYVAKLTRFDRVARTGAALIQHSGGGLVTTYGLPSQPPGFLSSLNISVTSTIAVGVSQGSPREMYADVQLSGRLVDAL